MKYVVIGGILLGITMVLVALSMPWCNGYLLEAGRPHMADASKTFGIFTGMFGGIILVIFPWIAEISEVFRK